MNVAPTIAVALLLACAAPAAADATRVIPPGQEHRILALVAPLRLGDPVAAGYHLANISIGGDSFTFVLEGEGLEPIHLRVAVDERQVSHRVAISPGEDAISPAGRQAATALRALALPRVDAEFWAALLAPPVTAPRIDADVRDNSVALVAALLALLAIVALGSFAATPQSALTAGLALLLGISPVAVWYCTAATGDAELREYQLVQLTLAVAAGAAVLALLLGARRFGATHRAAARDAGLVLAWSLFVRFGLTSANVLTDGGSGWSRLLEYRRGFGGIAVLLDVVLPDAAMWDAIAMPRLLAALSPPLLVLLGRTIGAGRVAAALAGTALASWPLHAALYSSDFESGAVVSVLIAGLVLVAHGGNRNSSAAAAAGLAVLAFGVFGRPEMLIVGLPLLALGGGPRLARSRPAVTAATAWLATLALVRLASLGELSNATPQYLSGPWAVLPFAELLTSGALLPYWLWLPLPLGALWLRGRARRVTLAGLIAGLVPLHVTPTMSDPTATYLEFFRYGAFAMPWLALLAGAGLAAVAAAIGPIARGAGAAAITAALVWMLATPLLERDYLAIHYGPFVDEAVFREALGHVPADCRLIVPDDPQTHFDVLKRYLEIAGEQAARRPGVPSPASIVGISDALRRPLTDGCWYFFEGSYCHDGFEGIAPPACDALLAHARFEPVWSRTVEYRSHRLVTRPGRQTAPWYEPRLSLTLYRAERR